MIRNEGIEGSDQQQDKRPDPVAAQGIYKISNAARKQTHLKQGIAGYGNDHIAGQRIAHVVEKAKQHGMHPGVVITVGSYSQYLCKLVDAVRRHDPWILVEIVGQPAYQAEEEGTQGGVIPVEIDEVCKTNREQAVSPGVCIRGFLPVSQQNFVKIHFIAGIGKQEFQQIIKEDNKPAEYHREYDETIQAACEPFYIISIIHQHI